MKQQRPSKAILSLNPTFDINFIADKIYSQHLLNIKQYLAVQTEPSLPSNIMLRTGTVKKKSVSAAKDVREQRAREHRASSQRRVSINLKDKPPKFMLRSSSDVKMKNSKSEELLIDKKLQGNHFRVRNYRQFFKDS